MVASVKMELMFISANGIGGVKDVYAEVSIADELQIRSTQRTPTDKNGGKSPKWNAPLIFCVPVSHAAAAGLVLHVVLRSERTHGDIGEVRIPLKELLGDLGGKAPKSTPQFVRYKVGRKPSGKAKGVINISYKFLEPSPAVEHADVSTAPAPAPGTSGEYPPQGYGCGAASQAPRKKSKRKKSKRKKSKFSAMGKIIGHAIFDGLVEAAVGFLGGV